MLLRAYAAPPEGQRRRLSSTRRTPGVASAATRIVRFCSSEFTGPQSSTTPSRTVTVMSQGMPHGCDRICATTRSRNAWSSEARPIVLRRRRSGEGLQEVRATDNPDDTAVAQDRHPLDPVPLQKGGDRAQGRILRRGDDLGRHDVGHLDGMRPDELLRFCSLAGEEFEPPGALWFRADFGAAHQVPFAHDTHQPADPCREQARR